MNTVTTELRDVHTALCAPFEDWEVRGRKVGKGDNQVEVGYVTASVIRNRLDEVLGWENWDAEYRPHGDGTVLCKLTITLPDGRKVIKSAIGGYIHTADRAELKDAINLAAYRGKAARSDALKLAAEELGVGRYLKRCGVPRYAREPFGEVAPPAPTKPEPRPFPSTPFPSTPIAPAPDDYPQLTDGRTFYAWLRDEGKARGLNLLSVVAEWGRSHDCPNRIIDWKPGQIAGGLETAERTLASIHRPAMAG